MSVSLHAHFIVLPYLAGGAELPGGKGLLSATNKGAGSAVAVRRAARRIFIVIASGCGPIMVLDPGFETHFEGNITYRTFYSHQGVLFQTWAP